MKRDVQQLGSREFDILVIGGGIYGACIARDAALRGLSVALIDKADFCSGTSHNSLKIIHSGLRYFQHFDFRRIRESIGERRAWLTLAPHLVRPLKFVIPTQGYLTRGPLALQAASLMHRAIGFDWNRGVPECAKIGVGRVRGKRSLASAIPGLPVEGLSGTASWYDGQVIDADRLVLECIEAAVERGAIAANYVSAESLLASNGRVHGAAAVDQAGGNELEIRARVTINAAGPWIQKLLRRSLGDAVASHVPPLAKNMNLVTRRPLPRYGIGIPSKRSSDAVIGSESRLFFITPWKDVAVVGTTHFPYEGDPDDYSATEAEIAGFVDEINDSYPPAELSIDDVLYVYSGLTPAEPSEARDGVGRSRHAEVIDHGRRHSCEGVISVIGVKFTTARLVAERTVSLAQRKLGKHDSAAAARGAPLAAAIAQKGPADYSATPVGSGFARLPESTAGEAGDSAEFRGAFQASVQYAVDQEMALTLGDVVFRRTDLAARGKLTAPLVRLAAETMGKSHGWSGSIIETSVTDVCASLRYLRSAQSGIDHEGTHG